jgi:hypothetical protein
MGPSVLPRSLIVAPRSPPIPRSNRLPILLNLRAGERSPALSPRIHDFSLNKKQKEKKEERGVELGAPSGFV